MGYLGAGLLLAVPVALAQPEMVFVGPNGRDAVYERKAGACVDGRNIAKRTDQSHQQCADWCFATAGCAGFEYGWTYKENAPYKYRDCQLQSWANYRYGDCRTKFNLDFYVLRAPQELDYGDYTFHRKVKGCVNGANIEKRASYSHYQCANWCAAVDECKAFEYGWLYREDKYKFQDCQLQLSKDTSGCDGTDHNLDLYWKAPKTFHEAPESVKGGEYHFSRIEGACVSGRNMDKRTDQTHEQCANWCASTAGCVGFEYGWTHNLESGVYDYQDCQLQNWANYQFGDCASKYNLDFYKMEAPENLKSGNTPFVRVQGGCVNGMNIDKRTKQTHQECADWCAIVDECEAFEYGWMYKEGASYQFQDCQLQRSAAFLGCDGENVYNLDLYVREKAEEPEPEPEREGCARLEKKKSCQQLGACLWKKKQCVDWDGVCEGLSKKLCKSMTGCEFKKGVCKDEDWSSPDDCSGDRSECDVPYQACVGELQDRYKDKNTDIIWLVKACVAANREHGGPCCVEYVGQKETEVCDAPKPTRELTFGEGLLCAARRLPLEEDEGAGRKKCQGNRADCGIPYKTCRGVVEDMPIGGNNRRGALLACVAANRGHGGPCCVAYVERREAEECGKPPMALSHEEDFLCAARRRPLETDGGAGRDARACAGLDKKPCKAKAGCVFKKGVCKDDD